MRLADQHEVRLEVVRIAVPSATNSGTNITARSGRDAVPTPDTIASASGPPTAPGITVLVIATTCAASFSASDSPIARQAGRRNRNESDPSGSAGVGTVTKVTSVARIASGREDGEAPDPPPAVPPGPARRPGATLR